MEGFLGAVGRISVNHTASGSWGEQFVLANVDWLASVAVTPAGDVHVAYNDGATIRARRYANDAWSGSNVVRDDSSVANSFGVGLAADSQENVILTWVEDTIPAGSDALQSRHALWVARFDVITEAWGDAGLISRSLSWIRSPKVSAGSGNTAIVSWLQDSVARSKRAGPT